MFYFNIFQKCQVFIQHIRETLANGMLCCVSNSTKCVQQKIKQTCVTLPVPGHCGSLGFNISVYWIYKLIPLILRNDCLLCSMYFQIECKSFDLIRRGIRHHTWSVGLNTSGLSLPFGYCEFSQTFQNSLQHETLKTYKNKV